MIAILKLNGRLAQRSFSSHQAQNFQQICKCLTVQNVSKFRRTNSVTNILTFLDKTFHPPLDESQLSVVALPPTPLKPENSEEVSSQILPLHRLSGSSLPNTSRISNTSLQLTSQIRQKPIAEVSPFSNFKVGL